MKDYISVPSPIATFGLLDYLSHHVGQLGDPYTSNLLAQIAEAQGNGNLQHTAALRLVAGLLTHEHHAEAYRAHKRAERRMAVVVLINELDLAYGRGVPVPLDQAHARLRQDQPGLSRALLAEAVQRRHLRDTRQTTHDSDGRGDG